jgi:hypothetical protein
VFENIHNFVSEAKRDLCDIQSQIQIVGRSDQLMMQEKQAQIKLDETLLKQEVFWQEKAIIRWHMDGYRNSSYFQSHKDKKKKKLK